MPNEKKVLEMPIEVSEDVFTNDKDEQVKYFSYALRIGDTVIRLTPKSDDKKLANHLLKELFNND